MRSPPLTPRVLCAATCVLQVAPECYPTLVAGADGGKRFSPIAAARGTLWLAKGGCHCWLGNDELAEVGERDGAALWSAVLVPLLASAGPAGDGGCRLARYLGGGDAGRDELLRLVGRRHELGEWSYPPLSDEEEGARDALRAALPEQG